MIWSLLCACITLSGDSLVFTVGGNPADILLLNNGDAVGSTDIIHTRKAKVSPRGIYCTIYEETYFRLVDSITTDMVMYDSLRNKQWQRACAGRRKISYDLSQVLDDMLILVTTDKSNGLPEVELIENNKATTVIKKGKLRKINDYTLSPNLRYIALHARNPYNNRLWDYIYFVDIETDKHWSYLFPVCLSCKRAKISMSVDDDGQVEVIYKTEHRIFSKDGQLVDIFMKVE
jgi:hypothetical protein